MLGFILILCGISMLMAARNLKLQGSVGTAGKLTWTAWIAVAAGFGLWAVGAVLRWHAVATQ